MKSYGANTLGGLLQSHDNDYGFNPEAVALRKEHDLSLSIVVPYFNTGANFERCAGHLLRAMGRCATSTELIVVDDGSLEYPLDAAVLDGKGTVVTHPENLGRTEARNTGLVHSTNDIVLFMDSDVLIDEDQLNRHLGLHQTAIDLDRDAIVVSFFEFVDAAHQPSIPAVISAESLQINDYRIDCEYGPTWIGCEEDKEYIGQRIRIVEATNNFRDWRGQYKAWVLPNMILGGLFSVQRSEIEAVGGFDSRFTGYGFTETSAVTKMIAVRGNVVVPSLQGGAYHIEDPEVNVSRSEKDRIFWERHDYYFNVFLREHARSQVLNDG